MERLILFDYHIGQSAHMQPQQKIDLLSSTPFNVKHLDMSFHIIDGDNGLDVILDDRNSNFRNQDMTQLPARGVLSLSKVDVLNIQHASFTPQQLTMLFENSQIKNMSLDHIPLEEADPLVLGRAVSRYFRV